MVAMGCAVLAAGCSPRAATVHPVSWYLQHAAEKQSKLAWCLDDAERARLADCLNAAEAKRRTLLGSHPRLAPIDWGAARTPP